MPTANDFHFVSFTSLLTRDLLEFEKLSAIKSTKSLEHCEANDGIGGFQVIGGLCARARARVWG